MIHCALICKRFEIWFVNDFWGSWMHWIVFWRIIEREVECSCMKNFSDFLSKKSQIYIFLKPYYILCFVFITHNKEIFRIVFVALHKCTYCKFKGYSSFCKTRCPFYFACVWRFRLIMFLILLIHNTGHAVYCIISRSRPESEYSIRKGTITLVSTN